MSDTTTDHFADRIYYADTSEWTPVDWSWLFVYVHRLIQFIGPTPEMLEEPDRHASRIQSKRNGQQDEELAAMDPSRMSAQTRYLFKHMLINQKRAWLAYDKFPNLKPLKDTETPELPIRISHEIWPPGGFAEQGIIFEQEN